MYWFDTLLGSYIGPLYIHCNHPFPESHSTALTIHIPLPCKLRIGLPLLTTHKSRDKQLAGGVLGDGQTQRAVTQSGK